MNLLKYKIVLSVPKKLYDRNHSSRKRGLTCDLELKLEEAAFFYITVYSIFYDQTKEISEKAHKVLPVNTATITRTNKRTPPIATGITVHFLSGT